jgi:hypothetical protein
MDPKGKGMVINDK